jgi:hypothetical protein
MTRRTTQLLLVGLVCSLTAAAACNKNNSSSTAPSPVLTTDTFTGTINPAGTATHAFVVNYGSSYTNASFTITSLTSVATGAAQSITLGIGFGSYNVGVCTRDPAFSNPAAPLNTKLDTAGSPFLIGTYCVQVFDNPAAPTVTEPMRYQLTIEHY